MKRKRKDGRMTNFEVVRHKRGASWISIYLCLRCSRAWQLPERCDSWRLKALLAHVDAHNSKLNEAMARMSEQLQTSLTEAEVKGQ